MAAHVLAALRGERREVASFRPAIHRQRAPLGIDEPVVPDACLVIDAELRDRTARGRRGREDLAHPVGTHGHDASRGSIRRPVAPPPRDVRPKQVVRAKLDVDLGAEPPAARPPASRGPAKRRPKQASDRALCLSVLAARSSLLDVSPPTISARASSSSARRSRAVARRGIGALEVGM